MTDTRGAGSETEADLGFVLDLLSGARPNHVVSARARQLFTLQSYIEGVESTTSESTMWWLAPDCSRFESDDQISVHNGRDHWTYEPSTGKATAYSTEQPMPGLVESHWFERRLLMADLEVLGNTTIGGRAAVALRVTAPEGNGTFGIGSHGFRPGQTAELAIDRETGMILRNASSEGGVETEIRDLVINAPLPDELFRSPIPPDAVVANGENSQQEFFTDLAAVRAGTDGPLVLPTILPEGAIPKWLSRETAGTRWVLQIRYLVWPGGQLQLAINQGDGTDAPGRNETLEEIDGIEVGLQFSGTLVFAWRHDLVHPAVVKVSAPYGRHAREVATAVARGLVEVAP